MKDRIRPPAKIDALGRVITDPSQRAHSWRLNLPPSITGGKKERKFFASEKAAKAYALDLLALRREAGTGLLAQLRAKNLSVTEAIEFALRQAPSTSPKYLKPAIQAFLESRRTTNCSPRYLDNLKSHLEPLLDEVGNRQVNEINRRALETYVAGLTARDDETPASPKTKTNVIISLSAFFNFTIESGWRTDNPAKGIRRPKSDETLVAILSPTEVATLLDVGRRDEFADVFPAVLIQIFAAPRRSELMHVEWEWIRDRYLRLEKTKVKKKRAVELSENVLAWLALYADRQGRIFSPSDIPFNAKDTRNLEDAYTYRVAHLAREAKVNLPKNVLRHTAITYRDAWTGDLAATAAWAGNSPAIIEQNYRGAATKDDAKEFYAIKPPRQVGA